MTSISPASEAYLKTIEARAKQARNAHSAASSLGQWIGSIVSNGATLVLGDILNGYPNYTLLAPLPGKKSTTLPNIRGQQKEIDDVIADTQKNPIILSESKWLKDARHLNDKGAWVALLPEVKQANKTVKGAISVLAGPWDAGGNIEALNKVVRVIQITREEVYSLLLKHGISIEINDDRNTYLDPLTPLSNLLDLVLSHAKNKRNFISQLGWDLVYPHRQQIVEAINEISELPDDIDMIDIADVNEVIVIYRTADNIELREVYASIKEASVAMQKHKK